MASGHSLRKSPEFLSVCFSWHSSHCRAEIRQLYPNKYVQVQSIVKASDYCIHCIHYLPYSPQTRAGYPFSTLCSNFLKYFSSRLLWTSLRTTARDTPGECHLYCSIGQLGPLHTYINAIVVVRQALPVPFNRIMEGPDRLRGVKCGDVLITYKMIWWDVRTSVDWVHNQVRALAMYSLFPSSSLHLSLPAVWWTVLNLNVGRACSTGQLTKCINCWPVLMAGAVGSYQV